MSGVAYQRGVVLEERLPESLPLVHADADRLKQVFINLIHNAIKFSANSDPRVIVFAEIRDGKAVLKVGDNGPGIAAGERSEEHTSELQSLMRTSYAVFYLKKKRHIPQNYNTDSG